MIQRSIVWLIVAWAVAATTSCWADSERPIGHWVFDRAGVRNGVVRDLAGRHDATISGDTKLVASPVEALTLDGATTHAEVRGIDSDDLPQAEISAEAWICLDKGTRWGGIVGFLQDNGSDEKGWLLGYDATHFNFSVSTDSKLPYLPSVTEFQPGTWYHVTGTYDGAQVRVYVNGQLENSTPLTGRIAYPPQATLTIGAYRDQNEFYPGEGLIHEVLLYDRVLTAEEVNARYQAKRRLFPETFEPALGPYLKFVSQSTAHVYWETEQPCRSVVEFGPSPSLEHRNEVPVETTTHQVTLTGLQPNTVYKYRIKQTIGNTTRTSKEHPFDTALNYTLPAWPERPNPYAEDERARRVREAARQIVDETGITQGYCLLLGCHDGQLAYELARRTQLRIVCVDTDPARLRQVADRLMASGIYGWRVSVRQVAAWDKLPFTKYFANLVVSEQVATRGTCPVEMCELVRVLRPSGGVAYLGPFRDANGPLPSEKIETWMRTGAVSAASQLVQSPAARPGYWSRTVRRPLAGAGQWTHQYGNPDNSANSRDDLQGACETGHLEVQWLGRPGADFGADRNPRMPAPLSVSGRLFHQGLDRMAALDAYNGTILWSLEIPGLLRVNMPRDASAWCADREHLYVAVRDRCWRLDAQTGNRSATYPIVRRAEDPQDLQWGYVAHSEGRLYGSTVSRGAAYRNIWGGGGEGWYDGTSGPTTAKVCSNRLFALQPRSGDTEWTYEDGAIINTTITIGGGHVYFVECRHPQVIRDMGGRIGRTELWQDQFLVALDAVSGEKVWERSIDTADGIVVFYLSYGNERLFITSSGAGTYHLYAFDAHDGSAIWDASHAWTSNNHSGHMQHPVVTDDIVYLEPCGYRAADGALVTDRMGRHEGCATYIATAGALIYRGAGRRIAMWDVESGKTTFWDSLRPSCWLSTIAAGGMVLSPEGGGGCSCANWLQTSLGFVHSDEAARQGERDER
jgi:outer membrane protein assembly factor BamB